MEMNTRQFLVLMIGECLCNITDKVKMEIQEAVKIMKERVGSE